MAPPETRRFRFCLRQCQRWRPCAEPARYSLAAAPPPQNARPQAQRLAARLPGRTPKPAPQQQWPGAQAPQAHPQQAWPGNQPMPQAPRPGTPAQRQAPSQPQRAARAGAAAGPAAAPPASRRGAAPATISAPAPNPGAAGAVALRRPSRNPRRRMLTSSSTLSRHPSRKTKRRGHWLLKWGLGALLISVVAFGLWFALSQAPDTAPGAGDGQSGSAVDPDDPRSRKQDRLPERLLAASSSIP